MVLLQDNSFLGWEQICNREKLNLILEIVEGDKKSDIRHAAVNERKNRNPK